MSLIIDLNNIRATATIIVDASHCSDSKVSGFSCWCVCHEKPGRQFSGSVTFGVRDSTDAEMLGILFAMHMAIKNRYVVPGGMALVQCDSMSALRNMHPNYKPTTKMHKLIKKTYDDLVNSLRLDVELRHVKGHVSRHAENGNQPKYISNRACDSFARQVMRAIRKDHFQLAPLHSHQMNNLLGRMYEIDLESSPYRNYSSRSSPFYNTSPEPDNIDDAFRRALDDAFGRDENIWLGE